MNPLLFDVLFRYKEKSSARSEGRTSVVPVQIDKFR